MGMGIGGFINLATSTTKFSVGKVNELRTKKKKKMLCFNSLFFSCNPPSQSTQPSHTMAAQIDKQTIGRYLEQVPKASNLISWSRNGFIAYIPPTITTTTSTTNNNNSNLLLTYIKNSDGKNWQLASPEPINIKLENNFLPQLSLVSWGSLNTDLAVSDIYGNFYILLAGVGLLDPNHIPSTTTSATTSITKTDGTTEQNKDTKQIGNGTGTNGHADSLINTPSFELTSYNHMEMIYRDIINPDINSIVNPGASIVAFKWLNIEKPQILNKAATRLVENPTTISSNSSSSSIYGYGINQYQPYGVCHPIPTKQACVALRKNGQFILFYQGEHKVEYHKISCNLTDNISIIEKASIGFNNSKQIIVTAWDSLSNDINVYSIEINWGFLVESAKRQKLDQHYHTPKEAQKPPRLTVKKLHQMKPNQCFKEEFEESQSPLVVSGTQKLTVGELSSIDIISSNPDPKSNLSILITYGSSVIYRYALEKSNLSSATNGGETSKNPISQAFYNLGVEKKIDWKGDESSVRLVYKDKLTRRGHIESVISGFLDLSFSIIYKDGTVDVIDTTSWKIVNNKNNSNNATGDEMVIDNNDYPPKLISNIFDQGFEFPTISHRNRLVLAISPTMSSVVYTEIYGDTVNLQLKPMERIDHFGTDPQDLYYTSVEIAHRYAFALYTSTCSDDLLVLIQSEISRIKKVVDGDTTTKHRIGKQLCDLVIIECHKAINFHLDTITKESLDKLLSNNASLQKLLSLQLILGEFQQLPHLPNNYIVSDIAWIVLNLRSASLGIMFTLSSIYRQVSKKKPSEDTLQDSITRGECIMSIIGNFKWLIDLLVYLNQELLQLIYVKNKFLNNGNATTSKLTLSNSIVLPLILNKVSRLFLMYAISAMGRTHEILKKLHKDLTDANKLFAPMKESLNRYFSISNNSPITVNLFENYLRECDALLNKEVPQKILAANKSINGNVNGNSTTTTNKPYSALKFEQKLLIKGIDESDNNDGTTKISNTIIEELSNMILDRYSISISRETKLSELMFYDTDWLNIGINKKDVPPYTVDALRKLIISDSPASGCLPKGEKLRVCTRCRAVSLVGDVTGLWTMVFQRTCMCGNPWVNV